MGQNISISVTCDTGIRFRNIMNILPGYCSNQCHSKTQFDMKPLMHFHYLHCATFTFIYYLYLFRHSYLELSLSFRFLPVFYQYCTFVSKVFQKCIKNVTKMFQKCFKVVCLHLSHRSYPSIRRACFNYNFRVAKIKRVCQYPQLKINSQSPTKGNLIEYN